MSDKINFNYTSDSKNEFYDIDAICRNAAIFWTLVPFEVNDHVHNYNAHVTFDYKWV